MYTMAATSPAVFPSNHGISKFDTLKPTDHATKAGRSYSGISYLQPRAMFVISRLE